MGFLDVLIGGAKALLRAVAVTVRDVVVETVKALEGTVTGRAASTLLDSWVQTKSKARSRAADLAAEEAEFAERMAKDGKLRPSDWDRKREIDEERMRLREAHAQADAARLKEDIEHAGDEARVAAVDADEVVSTIGLLSHKTCRCGGRMAVNTKHRSVNGGGPRMEFEWACPECRKREKFDPVAEAASVVRAPDLDLDLPARERHRLWNEPKTLAEANTRLASHLGATDSEVLCPDHLMPMRLFPSAAVSRGLLLDSYGYACTCTTVDGRLCQQKVPIERMAQASAALRRLEGVGMIRELPKSEARIYTNGPKP